VIVAVGVPISAVLLLLIGLLCAHRYRDRMRRGQQALLVELAHTRKLDEASRLMHAQSIDGRRVLMSELLDEVLASESLAILNGANADAPSDAAPESRFSGRLTWLRVGRPEDAALGLAAFINVPERALRDALNEGVLAMEREFASAASDEARECLHYVLHQRAGESGTHFPNSPFPRDCAEGGRVRADRTLGDGRGMALTDFMAHAAARAAKLEVHHLAALRVYSTAAFKCISGPLRAAQHGGAIDGEQIKQMLPATVSFLADAIKRLRVVDAARDSGTEVVDLYRGLRDVVLTDEFADKGGTDVACASRWLLPPPTSHRPRPTAHVSPPASHRPRLTARMR
jgi:hypothetical protein